MAGWQEEQVWYLTPDGELRRVSILRWMAVVEGRSTLPQPHAGTVRFLHVYLDPSLPVGLQVTDVQGWLHHFDQAGYYLPGAWMANMEAGVEAWMGARFSAPDAPALVDARQQFLAQRPPEQDRWQPGDALLAQLAGKLGLTRAALPL